MYQAPSQHQINFNKTKKLIKIRTSTGQQDRNMKAMIQNYRNPRNIFVQKDHRNNSTNQQRQIAKIANITKYRNQQSIRFLNKPTYFIRNKENQNFKYEFKQNRKVVLSQLQYMKLNASIANQKQKTERKNISLLWDPLSIQSRYSKNSFQKSMVRPQYIDRTYINTTTFASKKPDKIKIFSSKVTKPVEQLQFKKWPYYQFASLKGSKQYNQDSIKTGDKIWIVCDGHGELGHQVSNYASNVLYELFQQRRKKQKISKNMIKEIFVDVQRNLQESGIDVSLSGSTCVMVAIEDEKMFCACLGDSVAITIYENHEYQIISSQHKPCNPEEARRIQYFGGAVKKTFGKQHIPTSPLRLWGQGADQWGPGLAISRSFGDQMAQKYGLIYEPEIKQMPLSKSAKCIVLGSDGLFDQVKPSQMANILSIQLKKQKKQGCKLLTQIAKSRWLGYSDDISAVVIWL